MGLQEMQPGAGRLVEHLSGPEQPDAGQPVDDPDPRKRSLGPRGALLGASAAAAAVARMFGEPAIATAAAVAAAAAAAAATAAEAEAEAAP